MCNPRTSDQLGRWQRVKQPPQASKFLQRLEKTTIFGAYPASVTAYFAYVHDQHVLGYLTVKTPEDRPDVRVVEDVCFAQAVRGYLPDGPKGQTLAVLAGRQAFAEELFAEHSVNRNQKGNTWARKVGGHVPRRDEKQTPHAVENLQETLHRIAKANDWAVPTTWPSMEGEGDK